MTNKRIKGYRATIKQLLNRETNYNLSDYVRKINKKLGTERTITDIKVALKRMRRNGQIHCFIIDNKVYGQLTA